MRSSSQTMDQIEKHNKYIRIKTIEYMRQSQNKVQYAWLIYCVVLKLIWNINYKI